MKRLLSIFIPSMFYFLAQGIAQEKLDSTPSVNILPEEIQKEEICNQEEDLVVDRERNRDRDDERRNLYEYNRDTLEQETDKRRWKNRRFNNTYTNFPSES